MLRTANTLLDWIVSSEPAIIRAPSLLLSGLAFRTMHMELMNSTE
jgi:hypothetical protein